jgi:hypothetical protein
MALMQERRCLNQLVPGSGACAASCRYLSHTLSQARLTSPFCMIQCLFCQKMLHCFDLEVDKALSAAAGTRASCPELQLRWCNETLRT